jgi:hypothetical protein
VKTKIGIVVAALLAPLAFVGIADAAPKPPVATLTVTNMPTELVYSPDTIHPTVYWTYGPKDATQGNKYLLFVCYQGEKVADEDLRAAFIPGIGTPEGPRELVDATTAYLNTDYYGGPNSGSAYMRLWGWFDAEGRVYAMSTRWDEMPGDAWCYVEFNDWGNGSYHTYTSPTLIARSPQYFVNDPRVP